MYKVYHKNPCLPSGWSVFYKSLIESSGIFTGFFHEQDARVGKKGKLAKTFRIFLYSIWNGFAHIPTPVTLVDSSRDYGTGDMGFLKLPDFLRSNYMH